MGGGGRFFLLVFGFVGGGKEGADGVFSWCFGACGGRSGTSGENSDFAVCFFFGVGLS